MKLINKTLFFLFLFAVMLYNGQTPPIPGDDGGGGTGTGAPASPIDMYVYVLAVVGILFIIFYNKLKQRKLA